jgi:hypothetical protein
MLILNELHILVPEDNTTMFTSWTNQSGSEFQKMEQGRCHGDSAPAPFMYSPVPLFG